MLVCVYMYLYMCTQYVKTSLGVCVRACVYFCMCVYVCVYTLVKI